MTCSVIPDWMSAIEAARTAFEACGEPSSLPLVDAKRNYLAALDEDSMAAACLTDFCDTYPSLTSHDLIDQAERHMESGNRLIQLSTDALTRYSP